MATEVHAPFQLVGGHPALDFANTLDNRGSDREIELLVGYDDLLRFTEQSEVVATSEARQLSRAAQRDKHGAARALADATEMREAIFQVFEAATRAQSPPQVALDLLNKFMHEAYAHRTLIRQQGGYEWRWSEGTDNVRSVLWAIALQAAQLLASDDLSKVRSCASENCDWLFLDHSKSHSRRWCDMRVCGNRNKVRRFYQKQKS
jgi:predicted RNA-binding Zn ribbon-like protein